MSTLGALYQSIRRQLRDADIDSADLDARLLIAHTLGCAPQDVILKPDNDTTGHHADLENAITRRLKGEPVSKITGHREFYGLDFLVTRDVLDPRADSETIIDVVRKDLQDKPAARILDVCTGSGCLLITLLTLFPDATGVGTDISQAALDVARENAQRLGVADRCTFVPTSFVDGVEGVFDGLVCNPPYIRTGDIPGLDVAVRLHDPLIALDGGVDGLQPYKILFPQIRNLLKDGAYGYFEIGFDQGDDIRNIADVCGLQVRDIVHDLGGHERVAIVS